MPCSVVPPFTHNRYKTKRTRSAPCFLFVFPLFGRLIFVASQRFLFRSISVRLSKCALFGAFFAFWWIFCG